MIGHEFPYTNLHDVNIDWILQVVKEFNEKYHGIDDAIDAAIARLNATADELETAMQEYMQGLEEETTANINAIYAQFQTEANEAIQAIISNKELALEAIDSEMNSKLTQVSTLLNSLPHDYQDALNSMQIINATLNGTNNYPELVQGHYADAQQSDSKTLVPDNYRVSSILSAGCASRKLRTRVTNANGIIRDIIYWTGWGDSAVSHPVPVSTSTTDEKTLFTYTFPADATYFTVVFASDYNMLTAITPSDLQVEFQWIFDSLETLEVDDETDISGNSDGFILSKDGDDVSQYTNGTEKTHMDVGHTTGTIRHYFKDKQARDDIADLENTMDLLAHIEYSKNLFDKNAILPNKYLNVMGTISDYNGRYVTDYIPVTAGKQVTSSYYNAATSTQTQTGYASLCCYDEQKNVVTGGNINQNTFTVPDGVAYVRLTYSSSMYTYNGMVELTDDGVATAYVPYSPPRTILGENVVVAQSNVTGLPEELLQLNNGVSENSNTLADLLNTNIEFTETGFIRYDGQLISNSNYISTDYINCIAGSTFIPYKYRLKMYENTKIAYYNENKQFISAISPSSSSTLEYVEGVVPYVDKAVYIRFSTAADSVGHYVRYATVKNQYVASVPANPCDYSGNELSVFNKILCIGDSLTSGTFNYRVGDTTGNYVEYAKYSYPTYLKKLSGCDTVNMGNGGRTSDEWYTAHANDDLSGYDCAIVQLGVNDVIRYTTFGNTSETAFNNIFTKLKTENKNIKIFVANIIPASSYHSSDYIAFSAALSAFITGLNDKQIILLDMQQYGHTMDSSAFNCGHLSAYGYWRLAQDYKAYIGWYMNQNKTDFKEVQFIGTNYYYDPIS